MLQSHAKVPEIEYRLFVAVQVPSVIKNEMTRLMQDLKNKNLIAGTYPCADGMHLTLKFLGNVPQSKMAILDVALSSIKHAPMHVTLAGIKTFKDHGHARIVYVDIESSELDELAHRIECALGVCVPSAMHDFHAHLTIARIKKIIDDKDFERWICQVQVEPLTFTVDHFCLVRSELASDGPVHTVLKMYPIGS